MLSKRRSIIRDDVILKAPVRTSVPLKVKILPAHPCIEASEISIVKYSVSDVGRVPLPVDWIEDFSPERGVQ